MCESGKMKEKKIFPTAAAADVCFIFFGTIKARSRFIYYIVEQRIECFLFFFFFLLFSRRVYVTFFVDIFILV